ncbi:MAG: hypothetical protein EXR75_12140 [Myxococcales bacterium]|nr:hypothetical protein [Myxococcales bacterium]
MGGLLSACATDTSSFISTTAPTEIAVAPASFLGGLACSDNPGGLASYVLTLSAFTDAGDTTPFTLPSSQPTPCSVGLGTQKLIVAGALYVAAIDAYDRPAADLAPFGGSSSGSRHMLDANGKVIAPRWTTHCGNGASTATVALAERSTSIRLCEPLTDANPSSTSLSLSPAQLLGPEPCSIASAVSVAVLAAEPNDATAVGLGGSITLACDAEPLVVSVAAGVSYTLHATATNTSNVWVGAECFVVTKPGETVTPSCAPLSASGTVRLDLRALVDDDNERRCPEPHFYDLVGELGALTTVPLACSKAATLGPLDPGIRAFSAIIYDQHGQSTGASAACAADVEPGRLVNAVCL